jgi:RNA polymerase sigma-70 factor, ECF subfamily
MERSEGEAQERELLVRIGRGDERALRELHALYDRRIFAFAFRRLNNADDAQTIVSDTLFEVWKHANRFRGKSRLSTWILGIARNRLLMTLRDRDPEHEELGEAIPDGGLGSFDLFANKELRQGLTRCMEALSKVQRECLHLVFFEDRALREVAAIQQCPEDTVKTRLFYARKNIKDCVSSLLY